jgi:hypothetical protein
VALADLLTMQAKACEQRHDWAGAMKFCLDCMKLGSQIPHGGPIVSMFWAESASSECRWDLGHVVSDHLTPTQLRSAAQQVAQIDDNTVSYADVLQNEKQGAQASMLELFHAHMWRHTFWSSIFDSCYPSTSDSQTALHEIEAGTLAPRLSYDFFSSFMDKAVANAKLPWPQQNQDLLKSMPMDVLCRETLPSFAPNGYSQYELHADLRMLEVRLAIKAYGIDHHAMPTSLNQLVPKYIASIPIDPFTDNQPLKYRVFELGYAIYSVGPDGVDNGGTELQTDTPHDYTPPDGSDPAYPYDPVHAKGDLVSWIQK